MNIFQVFILAIVEGITEFLPISSTGHLVLVSHMLNIRPTEFSKSFDIIIQLGAIAAIFFLYGKKLLVDKSLWGKIMVAFLPTGIIGLVFYKLVKEQLLGNITVTLLSLFIGGILLILLEKFYKNTSAKSLGDLSYSQAFFIGIFQSFSIVPGVSRAAASIIGGLFMGQKRSAAVEFSFLLAVPTMLAATGYDLLKTRAIFTPGEYMLLLVGSIISFFVALLAVKFFVKFVTDHTFVPFGLYRILLAIVYFFAFL